MTRAARPTNEPQRLRALRECGVLDTAGEPVFDEITAMAAHLCRAPIAMISLVDGRRVWVKSRVGTDLCVQDRDVAFCAHAILSDGPLVIPDTRLDDRTKDHPLVTGGPGVRFYAAQPLITADGLALGTLCVLDTHPRALSADQGESLRMLGRQASTQLELRRAVERARVRERALCATNGRLHAAIDHLPTGAVYLEDGRFSYNQAAATLVGYAPGELGDVDAWFTALYGEDAADIRGVYEGDRAAGFPYMRRMALRRKDGAIRTVEFTAYLDSHVELWLLHDVTDREVADSERRKLQSMLQIAVDSMPQRVFWKDRAGVYLGCNLAFARDAGAGSVRDVVGTTDDQHTWREFAALYRANDLAVMNAGVPVREEEPYVRSDGSRRLARMNKIPLRDGDGRVVGVLGTFEDITEEREKQEELRRAKEAAEQASLAKSQFLANMSHEIRTPMTAILGFADLLTGANADDRAAHISTIRRNGEHLLALINDMLDISRIEAGQSVVSPEACSPGAVAREAVEMLRPRAAEKNLELRLSCTGGVPEHITADPVRLRQVLVNLLGNAIKFTEAGAVGLEIGATPGTGGRVRVAFRVSDSGIGMTPEQISRLFTPFSQGDASMRRRFGGAGLGLAISKRLLNLMGGDISVRSEAGRGSVFEAWLEAPAVTAAPPAVSRTAAAGLACRVLLAEDGADNQRLIAMVLRRAGATVEIASNGMEALSCAMRAADQGRGFDVVLMDMQMPVLDGYEATRALRGAGYDRPVVALTAHAMSGDREKCLAAGCSDYATKPIDRAVLIAMVGRWAGRAAA